MFLHTLAWSPNEAWHWFVHGHAARRWGEMGGGEDGKWEGGAEVWGKEEKDGEKNVEKLPDGKQGIHEKLCQVGQPQSVKPSERESHGHKLNVWLFLCIHVGGVLPRGKHTRVSIKASTHDWAEKWAYTTSKFQPTSSDMEREYANCASLRGFNKHVRHDGAV